MNIFLKTFSVKKYYPSQKKIFATSPPRVAGVGCWVVVCSGGVRITLHSAPRLGHGDFSQLQPRQPAHRGTLTQPATVGMWGVKGLLINVPQKRKITLKFMYYVKVFGGVLYLMQFYFELMRLTTILSLDMILNTLTQLMPLSTISKNCAKMHYTKNLNTYETLITFTQNDIECSFSQRCWELITPLQSIDRPIQNCR